MKLARKAGTTSEIWQVFIRDSSKTDGSGLTGLTSASSGLTAYYHRDTDTTATAITLVTMTVGTFTSSGFKEIDSTNMPGWYQFCPPNAALAAGARSCGFMLKGATNMAPMPIEVDLDAQVDVTTWNGTAVAAPATAGIPDVNVKNINNVATTSVSTINANVGTTQPTNFTGTGASAYVQTDIKSILGTTSIGSPGYVGIDWAHINAPTTSVNLSGTLIEGLDNAVTVSGNVTVGGYAAGEDPATLVLGATASSWNTAGTIGNKINSASAPTAAQVATQVWTDLTSGSDFSTAGSIGALLKANIDTNIGSRLATSSYTTPPSAASIATTVWEDLTAGGDFGTAGSIGKLLSTFTFTGANVNAQSSGNVTVGGYASGQDPATLVLDVAASSHNSAGSIGQKINSAGGAADPLTNAVPGSYGAGTAGYVLGTYLNASVSAIKTQTDKLIFDASNYVKTDPQTLVTANVTEWGGTNVGSMPYSGTPPTAAQIATQILTDTTGSDYTTAGSLGYIVKNNLDTNVGSRLAASSYTAPNNAGITSIVNKLPANNIADETLIIAATNSIITAVGSPMQAGTAVTVATNNDKTGYSLTQSFPTNFAALGISVGGHISNVDTLTTYTGNTPQSGDNYARLGAPAGASVSADIAACSHPGTAQTINTTTAIPVTGNTANSIADCLNAARAQGLGKWVISGTTLTLYGPDGTTVVKAFTLDSATAPTQRA